IFGQHINTTSPAHSHLAVQTLSPNLNIDISFIDFEIAANFAASGSSACEIQPVARWMRCAAGQNIHNLATFELVIQRHNARPKSLTLATASFSDDAGTRTTVTHL